MTSPAWPFPTILHGEAATVALAETVAAFLRVGDVIGLTGEIGAGKTTFARAVIQRLARQAIDVPSPTFTLVQSYPDLTPPIAHFDLYRLGSPDDLAELGFDEAAESSAVLVEWPERAGAAMPGDALIITLDGGGDRRRATIGGGGSWQHRLGTFPSTFP